MNDTALAGGTSPFFTSRIAAMVSASVFDAVNGIDPRFQPLHVRPNAPDGASQRAAAIQAVYVILVDTYPGRSTALSNQLNASLRKYAIHRRRCRLGTDRCRRHLGVETNGWVRACATSF